MHPRPGPSVRPPPAPRRPIDALALTQGGWYAVSGVWPLLHTESFEAITGPKTDRWLVHAVGVLSVALGTGLSVAALRRRVGPELRLVAALAAAGFAGVEVRNALRGRISSVYLLDAVVELGFLLAAASVGRSGLRMRR